MFNFVLTIKGKGVSEYAQELAFPGMKREVEGLGTTVCVIFYFIFFVYSKKYTEKELMGVENMEDHHGLTDHISTFGLSVGNSSPSFWNLILCRWRKRISSINYKLIIPNLMFKP